MVLKSGHIYVDTTTGQKVEFGYMGQTGLAIVYEPGCRNMQDSYGVDPNKLMYTLESEAIDIIKLAKHCGMSLKRCIEDLEDVRGWCFDLTDKIRELWDSPALPSEQRKQS